MKFVNNMLKSKKKYLLLLIPVIVYFLYNNKNYLKSKVENFKNSSDSVSVAELCEGEGTRDNKWVLTQELLENAIKDNFSTNLKTLYFRQGEYTTNGQPIKIDFGKIYADNHDEMLNQINTGVHFVGNYAVIDCGKQRGNGAPGFWILWDNGKGDSVADHVNLGQTALFYWKFNGFQFTGDVDNDLLRLGDIDNTETTFWNSCEFDLICNNGYNDSSMYGKESPARGCALASALESHINLVSAANHGTGALLKKIEFSTIKGSFSNGFDDTRKNIPVGARALELNECVSNTFLSVNLEMSYDGIKMLNYTSSNVFNTVISNNQDKRGTVIIYGDDSVTKNKFISLNIRDGINGDKPTKSNRALREMITKTHKIVINVLPIILIPIIIYILLKYKYISKKQRVKPAGIVGIVFLSLAFVILFGKFLHSIVIKIMNSV